MNGPYYTEPYTDYIYDASGIAIAVATRMPEEPEYGVCANAKAICDALNIAWHIKELVK